MITNREEVIDKAFRVFLKMNYEKASISTLAKACGLAKTGIVYYFPHKLDLFVAVADKFFIQLQNPVNKFDQPADTLAEFIDQYVAGVSKAMNGIVSLVRQQPIRLLPELLLYPLSFAGPHVLSRHKTED